MRFIGSKNNLLEEIAKLLDKHLDGNEQTFVDLFAGTNAVGNFFKDRFTIVCNDILYFSHIKGKAIIENNGPLPFAGLARIGVSSPLDYLRSEAENYVASGRVGYCERNYSPTGGAMYLSVGNAKRIDCIRDQIDAWKQAGRLTELEYFYLASCLIEAIPSVSNTTGTYGAYLKSWDKRALKTLELEAPIVKNNGRPNKSYNLDACDLIKELKADVVYIDTPYNARQYAPNYHLLENIARNDKPVLRGKTRMFDWGNLKSDFSAKTKAVAAMERLLQNVSAKHVLLSYSNEGVIPESELIRIVKEHAALGVFELERIPYRKYKSKVVSPSDELYEMLFYFSKDANRAAAATPKAGKAERRAAKTKIAADCGGAPVQTAPIRVCGQDKYIKSPVNYIGGKYRLLKQIIPLFPQRIDAFVDLFSGGANVGINAQAKRYVFNDMNSKINGMFRCFAQSAPQRLVASIRSEIEKWGLSKTNEQAYLRFRDHYNAHPDPLLLYVLAAFSYNYQFRFNNDLKFNNPFGRNRSCFSKNMESNLIQFVNRLRAIDAQFTDLYFDEFDYASLTPNDFVYLDPPYLITTGSYNDGNRGFKDWGEKEERKMLEILDDLSRRGIRYALSNVIEHKGKSNDILKAFIKRNAVRAHFLDFNYDNASHNSKARGSVEVLVTNY